MSEHERLVGVWLIGVFCGALLVVAAQRAGLTPLAQPAAAPVEIPYRE